MEIAFQSNLECVLNFYYFYFFVIQTWHAMRNMIAPADHALSTSFTHMTLRVNLTDCAAMTPLSVFLRIFLNILVEELSQGNFNLCLDEERGLFQLLFLVEHRVYRIISSLFPHNPGGFVSDSRHDARKMHLNMYQNLVLVLNIQYWY